MKFRHETVLHCSAEHLLAALAKPTTLQRISAPMLRFDPVDPPKLRPIWTLGEHRFRLLLGGKVPIGVHTINVVGLVTSADALSDTADEVWHDAGYSDLITHWDHRIELTAEPAGKVRYADVLDIRAGALTVPAVAFARRFYAHRQRRLRRLVASAEL